MNRHGDQQLQRTTRAQAAVLLLALPAGLLLAGCRQGTVPSSPAVTRQVAGQATPASGTEPVDPTASEEIEPSAATAIALATERVRDLWPTVAFTFGTQGVEPGKVHLPVDVGVDGEGNIYLSDSKGVQKFGPDGGFLLRVGGDALPRAQGIAVRQDGTVYVTGLNDVVLVFDPAGNQIGTIGQPGGAPGQLLQPVDAALDADGNLYVVDTGNYRVEKYSPDGESLLTFGERGTRNGQFTAPRVITVDSTGRIYVGMGDDFLIQRFSPEGTYLDTLGKSYADETMWRISGLAVDQDGHLYASQSIGQSIQCFDAGEEPALLWEYGTLGPLPGQFNQPGGLAVANGRLYVADMGNHRVQVLDLP